MTILAWINEQTNICENTSLDDRPASEIQIPGYIMLDLEQAPSAKWIWDGSDWVIEYKGLGEGGIGDTWDGTYLVEPKPASEYQPTTTGTQTI